MKSAQIRISAQCSLRTVLTLRLIRCFPYRRTALSGISFPRFSRTFIRSAPSLRQFGMAPQQLSVSQNERPGSLGVVFHDRFAVIICS